jgi:hypothetical protein
MASQQLVDVLVLVGHQIPLPLLRRHVTCCWDHPCCQEYVQVLDIPAHVVDCEIMTTHRRRYYHQNDETFSTVSSEDYKQYPCCRNQHYRRPVVVVDIVVLAMTA